MIALVNIDNMLTALLDWVKSDYTSKTDKTNTWLYKEFNGVTSSTWNFYNQLVNIMTKSESDSKRLTTHLSFPRNKAVLPYIFIHVPSENKGISNSLGFGDNNPYTLDEFNNEVQKASRSYSSLFDLIVVSDNEMVSLSIYEMLMRLLQASSDSLYTKFGFSLFDFSGKELMVTSDAMPDQIFHKSIQVKVEYLREVNRINTADVINAIGFSETNEEDGNDFTITLPVVLRDEISLGSSRTFLVPFMDYLEEAIVLNNYYIIKIALFYDNSTTSFLTYSTIISGDEVELLIYDSTQGLLKMDLTSTETTDREQRDVYYQITSYLTEDDYNNNLESVRTVKQYILTFTE